MTCHWRVGQLPPPACIASASLYIRFAPDDLTHAHFVSIPDARVMTPGAPAAEASTVARRSPVSQSPIRLYALPVVLFTLGLFFQLVVLPSSFTASHYEGERMRRTNAPNFLWPLIPSSFLSGSSYSACLSLCALFSFSWPSSVLGVVESASVDDVVGAYEKLSSKWYDPRLFMPFLILMED